MWELIRANKRRSMILVVVMLAVLLALGFVIGAAVFPSIIAAQTNTQGFEQTGVQFDPTGGLIGMAIAFVIWSVQATAAYFVGDKILLSVSGAREIQKEDHPRLFNVVEEMTIASSLGKMPRVYIIDDMALNAFATGRKPDNAGVTVTAGLLSRLNRDQLQGVVAHEITHIVNRDVLFMTMVGIMVGTILMISDMFLRTMFYSSMGRSRNSSDKKGNGGQAILLVIAIIFAILAPILAQVIYFAVSRRREYLADAGGAVYTRYPEGLAQALEIISGDSQPLQRGNRAMEPMYIDAPRAASGKRGSWFSTHPPAEERVKILRSLGGQVSYADYQKAWAGEKGSAKMPESALQMNAVPVRAPHADARAQENAAGHTNTVKGRMRETGDLLRNMNNFIFLPCVCGMRIKLPPDFKRDHVNCPRCKRALQVPVAQLAALSGAGAILRGDVNQAAANAGAPIPQAAARDNQDLVVTRKPGEWMTFKCTCGTSKTLSPNFSGNKTRCAQCGRAIFVKDANA